MLSIENWINNINSNKRLIENGRWLNITFTFGIGDKDYLFEILSGNVLSINEREILTQSGTFKIYGQRDSWNKHWLKVPPRDYHDIFAMLAKKNYIYRWRSNPIYAKPSIFQRSNSF